MTGSTNNWRQEGSVVIWRYCQSGRRRGGWHFTANPDGSASIVDLIERMQGDGTPSYRTLRLEPLREVVWRVPNFGPPSKDRFNRLRISYEPDFESLMLQNEDDLIVLTLGEGRADLLKAAFADVGKGSGDFGIRPSDYHKADIWMFWWMGGVDYRTRERK